MKKNEFLNELRTRLSRLPEEDAERSIEYYREMIDDRLEDGIGEDEAVAQLGSIDGISEQILKEIPMSRIVKKKIRTKKELHLWQIVLLIMGSPLWIPLLIAVLTIIFAVYVVIWSVLAALYATDVALVGGFLGGIVIMIVSFIRADVALGLMYIGAALACAGLAIFMFIGCMYATKGIVWLSKKIWTRIKSLVVGKENKK